MPRRASSNCCHRSRSDRRSASGRGAKVKKIDRSQIGPADDLLDAVENDWPHRTALRPHLPRLHLQRSRALDPPEVCRLRGGVSTISIVGGFVDF